jgi:peptide/nickel transport system permease protein
MTEALLAHDLPPDPLPPGDEGDEPARSPRREAWRRFRRNWMAMIGLVVIAIMVLIAIFAPLIRQNITHWYPTVGGADNLARPSGEHWFGTDQTGRDIFTRIMYGARISMRIGFISAGLATLIGVVLGGYSAYYGGKLDTVLMRITDIFLGLPYIILAIVLAVALGQSETTLILVFSFLGWMGVARIFRSSVFQVKEREFIEAARASGCSDTRILWRHVFPNAIQPVIAYAATFVGTAVLSEAALSFLGVGAVDPTPAWGLMVSQAKSTMEQAPHTVLFPGLAIFLMVSAFVFVGDGLRDALDTRGSR